MSGETERNVSGWTIDTLKELFESQHRDLRAYLVTQLADISTLLDERYATQTKATDAAFVAQQTAMKTAFDAADKAVQAALAAAKEASDKAQNAADKRFESVNEFRAQLTDQARTFLPRAEYEASQASLTEKIDSGLRRANDAEARNADRLNQLELRLTSRLDQGAGKEQGASISTDTTRWTATFDQYEASAKQQARNAVLALCVSGISVVAAIATILVVALHK